VGRAVFQGFLPGALENGRFVAAPEPLIVGKGLEAIQEGMEMVWEGVSAKKVVVVLEWGEGRGSAGLCVPLMHFTAVVFAIFSSHVTMFGNLDLCSRGGLGLEEGSLVVVCTCKHNLDTEAAYIG
jgi:hypothetical protein